MWDLKRHAHGGRLGVTLALAALCGLAATGTATAGTTSAASSVTNPASTSNDTSSPTYPDPQYVTGDVSEVHDPSMIRRYDGEYFLFSTHDGIEIRTSPDRVHWKLVGSVLPNGATWASAYGDPTDPWAPDVSYHFGLYYLYYAVSSFGSNHSAIGLATSRTMEPGSWTDHGLVLSTQTTDDYNALDPGLLVDRQGRWWLSLGSFWSGIKMVRLNPATGKPFGSDPTIHDISERAFPDAEEGSYIIEHGRYYYLFVSFDYCCQGVNSTYNVRVSRSTDPTGPYVDESGTPAMSGGGTEILATHGRYIGPGGQTVLRLGGEDLLVYHWYDGDNDGVPMLGINPLRWSASGWPSVAPARVHG
jgi:arabinan endo-1,5-alpha-L-arabinosidase